MRIFQSVDNGSDQNITCMICICYIHIQYTYKQWGLLRTDMILFQITTWQLRFLARNCSGCPVVMSQFPASSSRMGNSRRRVTSAVLLPVSIRLIVIMFKSATYTPLQINSDIYLVIGDCIQMILIATNHFSCIYWQQSFTCIMTFLAVSDPGPRLNIKTVLSTYGDFHVKDKTAVRTSYL